MDNNNFQPRTNSPLFWLGAAGAVYSAVVSAGVTAGVSMPWFVGAIGVALSTLLVYCSGNNPSMKDRY